MKTVTKLTYHDSLVTVFEVLLDILMACLSTHALMPGDMAYNAFVALRVQWNI